MERTSPQVILLVASALFAFAACGGSPTAQPTRPTPSPTQIGHVTVGGLQRVYVMFRPPSLGSKEPVPLVIAMHGYTSDTSWMEINTHFDDLAATKGFVVVYPQGLGDAWNAGECCGHDSNDDVGFIKALIDQLVVGGSIDPKRVFATGMSNGAFMAQRLACDLANQITAVASVSGSLVTDSCAPARAISVLEMHGLEDDLVPYKGGTVAGLTNFPPTMSNMRRWATLDGCGAAPTTALNGLTTTYVWSGCRDGSMVELQTVAGAGHTWFSPDEMAGEPDATQTAWDFFSHSPPLP